MRAVIIDDDEGTRDLLRIVLELEGWESRLAGCFGEAEPFLPTADLVVLDLHLPGMDGFDVIRWMQRHSVAPPTVLMTGDTSSETITAASRLGVRVLEKPFEIDDLLDLLATYADWAAPPADPAQTVASCSRRARSSWSIAVNINR